MSTQHNGSHYENHQRAAELHDVAAHAHRIAEQHGKQEHLTGHESSRQALEDSPDAYQNTQGATASPHSPMATSQLSPITSGKAEDVRKARRKKIGSAPWNICGPALSTGKRQP